MRGKTALILVSLFILYGKGLGETRSAKLKHITLATPGQPTMSRMMFHMGMEQGFYQKEGYEVELIMMKGPLVVPALIGGSIDYAGTAPTAVWAAAGGMPVKLIYVGAIRRPTYLVVKPAIKRGQDLKGKTIGTGGASEDLSTKVVAKQFGLDPNKDITIVVVGPGNKIPSLMAGSVDAVFSTLDEKVFLEKRGFLNLVRISDITGALSQGLGATDTKIRDKKAEIRAILKGSLKGLIFTRENKGKVANYMIKEWGYDRDLADEAYNEHLKYFTKDGTVSDDSIKDELENARLMGVQVKPGISLSQVRDFTLLREIIKELGL